MPAIYLKHPKHGTKVASAEMEAIYDESNGWERYKAFAPDAPKEPPPKADVPAVKRKYTRKTH